MDTANATMVRALHPSAPFVFFEDVMKMEPLTKTNGDGLDTAVYVPGYYSNGDGWSLGIGVTLEVP